MYFLESSTSRWWCTAFKCSCNMHYDTFTRRTVTAKVNPHTHTHTKLAFYIASFFSLSFIVQLSVKSIKKKPISVLVCRLHSACSNTILNNRFNQMCLVRARWPVLIFFESSLSLIYQIVDDCRKTSAYVWFELNSKQMIVCMRVRGQCCTCFAEFSSLYETLV